MSNIVQGSIWDFVGQGYIVIPTNGEIKKNGEAVMGAGLAKEAALRYPDLPARLGTRLKIWNHVCYFPDHQILTFPTKHHWRDKSDINLIMQSAVQLAKDIETFRYQQRAFRFFMPQVGCGLGGLKWDDVYAKIGPILSDSTITFVLPTEKKSK